jgi:hypothetical protein
MICYRLGTRENLPIVIREAGRSALMIAADRSASSCRAIVLLFFSLGLPSLALPATLEDTAKELAGKIAAALPAQETVSCEIRNLSSLRPEEIARIEPALKAALEERGVQWTASGAQTTVLVTLSENFRGLIWTAEIRKGDSLQIVLLAAARPTESGALSRSMPVTLHSEKFWEGPERILDAGEISNGAGKSWLVLLLPDGVRIVDEQSGVVAATEVKSLQSASRDPWGNLNIEPAGNSFVLFLAPRVCTVNLEPLDFSGCLAPAGSSGAFSAGRIPVAFDIAPPGPPPPGKGTTIEIRPVCGGMGQFLATGGRDYTQADSLQLFETKPSGAAPVSAAMDFPGPITALHSVSATPRAVVRNLATGNYEAYRLSFSCAQ